MLVIQQQTGPGPKVRGQQVELVNELLRSPSLRHLALQEQPSQACLQSQLQW